MKKHSAFIVLGLSVLACRPAVTIGWGEIILFSILLLVLLGPPLFRLYRRLDDFRRHERSKNGGRQSGKDKK